MYAIQLAWKSFNLNLQSVDTWARANLSSYTGNSADYALTLWFTEEPSGEEVAAVESYWDGISEASEEATSYVNAEAIAMRIAELKEGLISKTWDEMSAAERKLVSQLPVSNSELGF